VTGRPLAPHTYIHIERGEEREREEEEEERTQELWMGRRRGEPRLSASSVGTTTGLRSQRKRASRQRKEGGGREGEELILFGGDEHSIWQN